MPRKRTPRGPYSSATARRRGFHAITYGQWLQVTTSTVAAGAASSGTVCSSPSVSGSAKGGTRSPIANGVVVSAMLRGYCPLSSGRMSDLQRAVETVVGPCLGVKAGEDVVIVVDRTTQA